MLGQTNQVSINLTDEEQLPSIAAFTATPENIVTGESSTLTWEVTGVEPITVNIEGTAENVGASGSVSIAPEQTTSYTLTATNIYGEVTSTVTVNVATSTLRVCRGDITAINQAEIDSLAGCTHIEGSLTIRENYDEPGAIRSLAALSNLQSIEDNLIIGGVNRNAELSSLTGLNSLEAVGGSVRIIGNDKLISLDGLNSLKTIGGSLILGEEFELISGTDLVGNDALTSLEGLNNLTSIGGAINLDFNFNLTSLKPLANLRNVKSISIYFGSIESLEGIENIVGLESFSMIVNSSDDNPTVTTLEHLPDTSNLEHLSLVSTSLVSLEGIGDLSSLKYLWIDGNNDLISLEGLADLPSLDELRIRVSQNVSLANLTLPASLETLILAGNFSSLQGLENVRSVGRLELNLGEEITSLAAFNRIVVSSVLSITSSGLTSLEGLEGITSLNGLIINSNAKLESLRGLDNLKTITPSGARTGYLDINSNEALVSLEGLESLTGIGGRLSIDYNPALVSLQGIAHLTNDVIPGGATINGNTQLNCPAQPLQFSPFESRGNLVDCAVTGPRPLIPVFTATPNSVEAGQSATLTWSVTGPQPITVRTYARGKEMKR